MQSSITNKSGNIYVADTENNRIQKFSSDWTLLWTKGWNGQFNRPNSIAVNNVGNIYVADSKNRIQIFDNNGNYISQFGTWGNGNGQFQWPGGIAISTGGDIYVVDGENNRIQKFDSNGNYISQFGTWGNGNGQFEFQRWTNGIAITSWGNIYVVDNGNSRIQKFNSNGNYISQFGTCQSRSYWSININCSVEDIAITSGGNIYMTYMDEFVSNIITNGVKIFDNNGNNISQFGFYNDYDGPSGITITNWGNIYVAYNNNIKIFDNNTNYISQFDGYTSENQGKLRYPGETIVYNNKVYVLDRGNNRVQIYNLNGNYISQFWSRGTGNGQFQWPSNITISTGGSIYVVDNGNSRIQKFDSNGNYISQFGTWGNGNGQFQWPNSIAVNNVGNIYVVDNGNSRIQKFDSNGNYISQFGSLGTANGQFQWPNSIAITTGGNIYVADTNNNRIQKFDSNGNYISQFGYQWYTNWISPYVYPNNIIIDNNNNIYINDVNSKLIQKFNSSGTYITQFDVGFNGWKVWIDTFNNMLYITDTENNMIKRYRYDVPATLLPIIKTYSTGQVNPLLTGASGLSWDIISIYSGWNLVITWQVWSGNIWNITLPVTITTWSITFTFKITNNENNSSPLSTLTLIIDKVGPIVTLSGTSPMTINQNSIFIDPWANWTDTVDISWVILTWTASWTALNISVIGTYYLNYTYTDRAGNTGNTVTRTVIVQIPQSNSSSSNNNSIGYGGGGGGSSLMKDNCPINEDYSASYYDGTCGTKPNTSTPSNNNDSLQSLLADTNSSVSWFPRPLPQTNNSSSQQAMDELCQPYSDDGYSIELYHSSRIYKKEIFIICWMSENKLSKFNKSNTFRGNDILRRDESTKFMYNFMTNILDFTAEKTETDCNYTDLTNGHADLWWYITNACKIGLYNWSNSNKLFNPTGHLTAGNLSTLFSKVTNLYNTENGDNNYSTDFLTEINELQNKNEKITRMKAAHALYQLSQMI